MSDVCSYTGPDTTRLSVELIVHATLSSLAQLAQSAPAGEKVLKMRACSCHGLKGEGGRAREGACESGWLPHGLLCCDVRQA